MPHLGRMSAELGVGRALGGVTATVWLALAAHHLSVREFGQLALVLSLGSLVAIGADLGVPLALSKLACDHDEIDRHAVAGAIRRRVGAGVLGAVVLIALWTNAGDARRWWLAAIYGVSVIVTPVTGSFLALLRGRGIGSVEAGYELASKVAVLGLGVVLLAGGVGVAGALAAFVIVDCASSLVVPPLARRKVSLSDRRDPEQAADLRLRATLPLVAAGVLGSAYERIDIWLVALLLGNASVALYAAAYKLYDAVLMPARAVASSAVAAAGRDVIHNGRRVAGRLTARTLAVTAPLALAAAWAAPAIIRVGFGGHYAKANTALRVLTVATIPGAALAVVTPIALLCRRRFIVACTAGGLVANVVANLVLVPTVGVTGAAVAFLITETALLVLFGASLWMEVEAPAPKARVAGEIFKAGAPPPGYPGSTRP